MDAGFVDAVALIKRLESSRHAAIVARVESNGEQRYVLAFPEAADDSACTSTAQFKRLLGLNPAVRAVPVAFDDGRRHSDIATRRKGHRHRVAGELAWRLWIGSCDSMAVASQQATSAGLGMGSKLPSCAAVRVAGVCGCRLRLFERLHPVVREVAASIVLLAATAATNLPPLRLCRGYCVATTTLIRSSSPSSRQPVLRSR